MLPQRRGGQFYSKLEMNNSLDYLNIDIPSNWNKDQNSWTLNKSECMSIDSDFVNKWVQNYKVPKMEQNTLSHSNNQINMLKIQLQQINNQIQQLQLHRATFNQLDETDEVLDNITNIDQNIDELRLQKQNIQEEIDQSLEISKIFQNRLPLPQCSNEDKTIPWKIVYNALPTKTDGSDREEFAHTWKIVKSLAETHEWSEKNICEVLNHVLIGEAADFFQMKQDKPFKERLSSLLTAYTPTDNYMTRRNQLQSFKRLKGDSIEQFMSKLEYYIERTNIGYPSQVRRGRKDNILEETLLRVCSTSARQRIQAKMNEAFEAGYFLDINDKIAIASRQEMVANDMPEEDISISLNEYDNTKRNIYAFNTECYEDADLNTVSSQFRNSPKEGSRLGKINSGNERESRRKDLMSRRSSSREDLQQKNRRVSFNLPDNELKDKQEKLKDITPEALKLQRQIFANTDQEDYVGRYNLTPTPSPNRQESRYNLVKEQQKMIEDLQIQLHQLKLNQQRSEQFQRNTYTDNLRPKINRTYTVRNLYPEQFAIQIEPPRSGNYYNNTQNRQGINNYGVRNEISRPNESQSGRSQNPPRTQPRGNNFENNFTPRRNNNYDMNQSYSSNRRGGPDLYNQSQRYTQWTDRQEQQKRLVQCHYCGSSERHNWSECGRLHRSQSTNKSPTQQLNLQNQGQRDQGN